MFQVISQSTFMHYDKDSGSCVLVGLEKEMTAGDIRANGGLDTFVSRVSNMAYISYVKEFRAQDVGGIMSLRLFTMLGTKALNGFDSMNLMTKVMSLAASCKNCLLLGLDCVFDQNDSMVCLGCKKTSIQCVGFMPVYIYQDMASDQVAAVKLLAESSDPRLNWEAGFAGLHINKSLARSFRNYKLFGETGFHNITSLLTLYNDPDSVLPIPKKSLLGRDKHHNEDNYNIVNGEVANSQDISYYQ